MSIFDEVLGSGVDFPIKFEQGRLKTATGVESVIAAIWMLFGTRKGSRFFEPEYGSLLPDLIFEPCNKSTALRLEILAKDAIYQWIPRVERVEISSEIRNEESCIMLQMLLSLRNSSTELMMTFPYYLESSQWENRKTEVTYAIIG